MLQRSTGTRRTTLGQTTDIDCNQEKRAEDEPVNSENDNVQDLHDPEVGEKESEQANNLELEQEKKQQEDFKSKFYYLAAEFENVKKRFDREKSMLVKYGNEKVLLAMIELIDNLERTIVAIGQDQDEKIINIHTGIAMVRDQFLESLKSFGLERVSALGKEFDPAFHEALAQMPHDGKKDDEIIQVYQEGYLLNGRLIRAAKVVVVKN